MQVYSHQIIDLLFKEFKINSPLRIFLKAK